MGITRKHLKVLDSETVKIIVDHLEHNKDLLSCDICREHLWGPCETCSFPHYLLRNVLIESYIPLVQHIARKLGGKKFAEARSVGLLALTKVVNKLPANLQYPDTFIGVTVTREIKRFLILDTTIKVPAYGSATHRHLRSTFSITDHIASQGEQDAVDLIELLNKIPQTKNEETILKCIVEGGYSLKEMASLCTVGEARVSQIKQDLLERVLVKIRAET